MLCSLYTVKEVDTVFAGIALTLATG